MKEFLGRIVAKISRAGKWFAGIRILWPKSKSIRIKNAHIHGTVNPSPFGRHSDFMMNVLKAAIEELESGSSVDTVIEARRDDECHEPTS